MDLEQIVTEANAILADKEQGSEKLQLRIQTLLAAMANAVDGKVLHQLDNDVAEQAVVEMRDHVFVDDFEQSKEKIAASFGWPPVLPTSALIVNLVRGFLRNGLNIEMGYNTEVKFDFDAYADRADAKCWKGRKNGWVAFYIVFGNMIRYA